MTKPQYLIWSNYSLDYEDWREDLEAEYPELSEQEREEKMYERNSEYLDDERMNLDIQLDKPILVIVDLGLWNGRYSGYKEIKSGNIKDCLFSECDYVTWYVDRLGDMRCEDGVSDAQIENLKEKIYRGTATRADITRITRRLGDEIGKVYGWDFPKQSLSSVQIDAR